MSSLTAINARHVNSYHHHSSLLFQFILAEFTDAFEEIRGLQMVINQSTVPLENLDFSNHANQSFKKELENSLVKLVGSPKEYLRFFSWNINEGMLSKLKTYCALFLHNADQEGKERMAMQHYVDKAWQNCMQVIDIINDKQAGSGTLSTALEKTAAAMGRFAKVLGRLLHQFRDDENVIYFVVRHHKLFDKLYGSRFVIKLLTRLFSKGLEETQTFLETKYSERGFTHLLPAIHTSVAEIGEAAQ